MTDVVIIKKYSNRRLYDTQTSSYITQEDLLAIAKKGEKFEVKDAKTGEDLTRQILTQIIFEEESKKTVPLLPVSFLRNLIKLYDNNMQSLVPTYLEKVIESFYSIEKTNGIEKIETTVKKNMEFMTNSLTAFNPFASRMPAITRQAKLDRIKYLESEIVKLKEETKDSE